MKAFSASLRLGGLILLFFLTAHAQPRDYTRWVNPFIGTGGHGHTFPGATVPFGMVQLSPDTRIDNWDGSSGYHYSDNIIYGFSHTHLSGTGIPDGCDILFMPTIGEPEFFAKDGDKSVNGYASKFSHANEKAEPGYYSVKLDDDGVLAEMTATKRVGFHRYTFPKSSEANIILDLGWRDKVREMRGRFLDNRRVEGYRISSSWAKRQVVYFAAEFSKPYTRTQMDGRDRDEKNHRGVVGNGLGRVSFRFDTLEGEPVSLKVGISYVSIKNARKNLEAELPGWDFDKVRADAKAAWNKELAKIEVSGGTDEQTTNFYTALYHTMIHPNVFNDVDGRYKGHDGKTHALSSSFSWPAAAKKPAKAGTQNGDQYTVFSLWDTFRAAHPLYTIIDQKRTVDYINSFIRIYEQGGRLPVWELWGEETDTMIGYHAVSVIADAMAKGIEGFDYEKAYAAAKHSAELDHFGLAAYKKRGYISSEDENESVSKTLEYAYNDWCILQIQKALSQRGEFRDVPLVFSDPQYAERARYFANLFDSRTGFFRPKRNGSFIKPFAPNEVTFHFTEGNSWQYSFFVPQDISGLIELHGGRSKFAQKIDELFTTDQKLTGREQPDITGLIGQYAHGNEPSHHIPYLYNYADEPAKTQKYVRKIMDEFYKNSPDGLIGNEDCGQMSAWYVFSAMGFYPVTPGKPSYALGSPLFKEVKINLENGKVFTVRAPNVSEKSIYVKSTKLNGRGNPLRTVTSIDHESIVNGGLLEFEMSEKPEPFRYPLPVNRGGSKFWYTGVRVPVIEGNRVFTGQTKITISTDNNGADLFYTLDGSEPATNFNRYAGPITVDRSVVVKAVAVRHKMQSPVVEAKFDKRANDWTVKLVSEFNSQYTGSGYDAIIDGLRGNTNFAAGEWQGYQGKTFEAVIDLQRETDIKNVGGSFLQAAGSWIWMPDRIEFEVSGDGANFTKVTEIKPAFPQTEVKPATREFRQAIAPVKARFVRVRAYNFGKIPAWHPGAGGDPWIFVDEIFINQTQAETRPLGSVPVGRGKCRSPHEVRA